MRVRLVLAVAVAVATLASGSQAPRGQEAHQQGTLLRVAFMMGARGNAPLPVPGPNAPDPRAFDGWDPTADNPELEHILGLTRVAELARASVTMSSDDTPVLFSTIAEQRRYELIVDPAETSGSVVYLGLKVKEDGKDVSQPRIGLQIGQKGVVCARVARGDGEAFVFFVLQLDAG
jgi:hypothetical protein